MKPLSFKIASVLSIFLLIVAIVLLFTNPKKENNLTAGYSTPIIAFEFIEPFAVKQFFAVKDPVDYENKMLLGNKIDYLFMLIYSALLFFIAHGIYKLKKTNSMILAMFLCFVILLSDALENLQIYAIIKNYRLDNIQSNLEWLHIFTWLKWINLAAVFILLTPFFIMGNWYGIVIAISCVSSFLLSIIGFFTNGIWHELFALSVSIVFLLLTIFTFTFKTNVNSKIYSNMAL